jgi:hypothetical protein
MMRLGLVAVLWCGLWLPPLRNALESDMPLHMTVQLPLLAATGVLMVPAVCRRELRWLADADWLGIPGLVLVLFSTSYWMLPVALDSAFSDWRIEAAKFVSLPLAVGLPLGLSWQRMPPLGRAFVIANVISKLGAVGGLFLAAPVRVCAYYPLDQQVKAGGELIGIATALAFSRVPCFALRVVLDCAGQIRRSSFTAPTGGRRRYTLLATAVAKQSG